MFSIRKTGNIGGDFFAQLVFFAVIKLRIYINISRLAKEGFLGLCVDDIYRTVCFAAFISSGIGINDGIIFVREILNLIGLSNGRTY